MTASMGRAETIVDSVRKTIQLTEHTLQQFESTTGKLPTGQSVVILGPTGAGKSTFIHLLAGDKLYAVHDQNYGRMLIDADSSLSTARVKISHRVTSETQIPNKWVDKEVTYWDCPGWFDNRGVAQEIANAVCIHKVFSISQKVKILFMITDAQLFEETRPTALFLFIKTLQEVFSQQIHRIKESIGLIVSHADEARTEEHVIHRINNIFQELCFSDEQAVLLESLTKQPIIILKKPAHIASKSRYLMDTGKLRAQMFNKIEKINYLTGIQADIVVSSEAQVALTHSYHTLITEINKAVKQFADMFRKNIDEFAASYTPQIPTMDSVQRQKAQLDLEALIYQLDQTRQLECEIATIPAVITSCLNVSHFFQADLSADGLIQALEHIEIMENFENFVDTILHVPLDIVKYMREQIEYTRTKLEILKINIIAVDAQDKAEKEKQRAEWATRRLENEKANYEKDINRRKQKQSEHIHKVDRVKKQRSKWWNFLKKILDLFLHEAEDYLRSRL